MAVYARGAAGPEVTRLQARLAALGLYLGPLDGLFGGGTEAAVRAFQGRRGLTADGRVDAATWAALFDGAPIPEPALTRAPLAERCLALTGAFETGRPVPDCFSGLTGDFDGQGLSFGALQWNLGQRSLQPLLAELLREHVGLVEDVFGPRTGELRALLAVEVDEQLDWARSIQDARHVLAEPWRGCFKALGRTPECRAAQLRHAAGLFAAARAACAALRLESERAAALLFDVQVQNGGLRTTARARIQAEFEGLPATGDARRDEAARLVIVAEAVAAASKARWRADVRQRKLAIARGAGHVHGRAYDLERQYGIRLNVAA